MRQLFKHLPLGGQVTLKLVHVSLHRSQHRTRSAIFWAFLISIAAFGFAPPSHAGVTQVNITCVQSPTFGGASFGSVGQYELIQGTFTGEVDPSNPQNAVIVDIQNAPRNAQGLVTYSADFQIFRPIKLSQGNHRVIFDLPNRGGATALSTFNNGTGNDRSWCTSGLPAKFTVGDGFLMNEGFTVVDTAWDITVTPSGSSSSASFGVSFPVATKRDGSVITGPATEEFDIDFTATVATEPALCCGQCGSIQGNTHGTRELRRYTDRDSIIGMGVHRFDLDGNQAHQRFGLWRTRHLQSYSAI